MLSLILLGFEIYDTSWSKKYMTFNEFQQKESRHPGIPAGLETAPINCNPLKIINRKCNDEAGASRDESPSSYLLFKVVIRK